MLRKQLSVIFSILRLRMNRSHDYILHRPLSLLTGFVINLWVFNVHASLDYETKSVGKALRSSGSHLSVIVIPHWPYSTAVLFV